MLGKGVKPHPVLPYVLPINKNQEDFNLNVQLCNTHIKKKTHVLDFYKNRTLIIEKKKKSFCRVSSFKFHVLLCLLFPYLFMTFEILLTSLFCNDSILCFFFIFYLFETCVKLILGAAFRFWLSAIDTIS